MNTIAIIIVSWNARNFLRQCLDSIRETSVGLKVEVVVVDNASTDGSPEMVLESFPEVKLIKAGDNLGFARANNLGLKQVAGDYYAFINSDVVVHPNCLQQLAGYLGGHPKVGLVGPWIAGGDGKLQRSCRRLPTVWNTLCRTLALDGVLGRWPLFSGREMRHWEHDTLREVEVLSGCFWLARRNAVTKVGGLDERFFFYAEDVDWCKRFWDAGWKVMFIPMATATHFGGGSSANAPLRYSVELLRANLTYWRKHHTLLGCCAFRFLLIIHHAIRLIGYVVQSLARGLQHTESVYKCRRSWACLRWLFTGRGV